MAFHESKVILKDAEAARDAITAAQYQHISNLYTEWADELGEQAKFWAGKDTQSAMMRELQYKQLQKAVTEQSHVVSNGVYQSSKDALYTVSEAVVSSLTAYTVSLGFEHMAVAAAYNSIPTTVVNQLVTGQLYENGWNLSSAIWGNNEKELQRIYEIMAGGLAQNKSAFEIAKTLEQYVNPNAAKQWNLVDAGGVRIYPRSVDYSAQRLVRTLSQHSYQSTLVTTTKNNPFIEKFVWHAEGSRACPMCTDLDGIVFDKGKLPLDHPNGMCTFEPVIDENLVDKLADWVNSPDGTYPDIDGFAKSFGYTPQKAAQKGMQYMTQAKGVVNTALNATTYADCIKALDSYMGLGGKTAGSYVDNVVTTIAKGKKYGGSKEKVYQAFVNGKTTGAQTKQIENAIAKSQKQVAKVLEDKSKGVKNYAQLKKEKEAAEAAKKAAEEKAKFEAAKKNFPNTLGKNGAGSESKSWQTWYKKLTPEDKRVVDALKKESGKGWATWYQENVYTGKSYVSGTKAAKDANKAKKASQTVSGGSNQSPFKLDAKTLNAYLGDTKYMTTDPLYKAIEKEFGSETLAEFKQVIHEIKGVTNRPYHIDVWNDYVSGKLGTKLSGKIDDVFEKHASKVEKIIQEKAAKEAAEKAAKEAAAAKAKHDAAVGYVSKQVGSETYSKFVSYAKGVNEANEAEIKSIVSKMAKENGLSDSQAYKAWVNGSIQSQELDAFVSRMRLGDFDREEWFTMLRGNTHSWMKSNQAAAEAVVTRTEHKAIQTYTGSAYGRMNNATRNAPREIYKSKEAFYAYAKEQAKTDSNWKDVYEATKGLSKTSLERETVIRRGTGAGEIGSLFGNYESYYEAGKAVKAMSLEEMRTAFIGQVGVYDSVVSASPIESGGFHKFCEVVIKMPVGTEGCTVWRGWSSHSNEEEFIMNIAQKVICRDIEKMPGGGLRCFVEVVL